MIDSATVPRIQSALIEAELDGWLLYDFRGSNPIAAGVVKLPGLVSRRFFVFIPARGNPTALTHAIEQSPWRDWPKSWANQHYSSWKQLEAALKSLVGGKRVAMEYSAGDAVPYVDRVPAGVIEMVRAAGATIVTSADLISRFYAVWSPEQRASHERAAEVIAEIAKDGFAVAGARAATDNPMSEFELRAWIEQRFAAAGLEIDHGPIVAIGPNAANPHYEPLQNGSAKIKRGDILLIDLFAREKNGVYADQTWMASLGKPSARDVKVWEAVRDARDAAIELLRRKAGKSSLKGGEVDDAARYVITARGFGEFFIHRTGHSIDPIDLHGSGPNIDNMETRDERTLLPGVGFSIEPGVYLAGDLGMRSEVNAFMTDDGVLITPKDYQRDLIIV
jgi:Xaa-Pro aminopeptidase